MLRKWLPAVGAVVAAAALLLTPAASQARGWGWGGYRGGFGWGGYRGLGWGGYRGLGWGYGGYRGLGWGYYPRYYGGYWGSFYPYGMGYYGYYPSYYRSWYYPGYYGSYYPGFVSSSSYYPTYVYGTSYLPSSTYGNLSTSGYYDEGTPPANRTMVRVEVPRADAEVWIDGQRTQQRGMDRLFESPTLTTGKSYHYDVRARWTENGQTFDRTRTVHFRPGERVTVDFRQPAPQGEGATK